MRASAQRLYVNIDHVATLRQARRGAYPDPVAAVPECERAGADGITAHLREDRRHMIDADIPRLRAAITTYFNLEIAATEEMRDVALAHRPDQVTLVPERREEITTEGGLDVHAAFDRVAGVTRALTEAGIRTSLFIAPDADAVRASRDVGAAAIELHTGDFAHHPDDRARITALRDAAELAATLGLAVHAGHGLSADNLAPVAAIDEIEELNIGHWIVSRAVFVGLARAIEETRDAMTRARDAARPARTA